MNKSLIVKLNDDQEKIILCNEDISIWATVQNNLNYKKHSFPELQLRISGMEFGDKNYNLEYADIELKEGDSVNISYSSSEEPNSPPTKREEFKDEKKCLFCEKSNKDVEYLFEKDSFRKICSECIEACTKDLESRRA